MKTLIRYKENMFNYKVIANFSSKKDRKRVL